MTNLQLIPVAPSFSLGHQVSWFGLKKKTLRHAGNVISFATTGSGERHLTELSIIDHQGSAVVLDTTGGGIYNATYEAQLAKGHRVVVVDPSGVIDGQSKNLNCLDFIDPTHPDGFKDATTLAEMLVYVEPNAKTGQHLDEDVRSVIALLVFYAAGLRAEARCMSMMRDILAGGLWEVERALRVLVEETKHQAEIVKAAQKTLRNLSQPWGQYLIDSADHHTKFLEQEVGDSSAKTVINSFVSNASVFTKGVASEPGTPIRPHVFDEQKTTVYIITSALEREPNPRMYRALVGMMMVAAHRTHPNNAPVGFFLYGGLSLGRMKPVSDAICSSIKTQASFWLSGSIDLPRLQYFYPSEWQLLMGASAHLLLNIEDQDTHDYFRSSFQAAGLEDASAQGWNSYRVNWLRPIAILPGAKALQINMLESNTNGSCVDALTRFRRLFGSEKGGVASDTGKEIVRVTPTTCCVKCNAPMKIPSQAILSPEYRCGCGVTYKVVSAISDPSQLRGLDIDPKVFLGNCSMKFFVTSEERPGK